MSHSIESQQYGRPLALVVDDEVSICETLCSVLEDERISAVSACDGAEAICKLKEIQPDVVFLDIWMPGWDGIETLERIKAISPSIEVIMISGHATIANALEATKKGAFDFIEKPLDIDSVISSVNRALANKNKYSENSSYLGFSEGSAHCVKKNSDDDLSSNSMSEIPLLMKHVGVCSKGCSGNNIGQRTIARSTILYGRCLHSGQKSGLVLEPLPLDSGVHFVKVGDTKSVPAFIDFVNSTSFATKLSADGVSFSTIEHLLSVLHAYKITNLLIKCNDEVPIFDGSASQFCELLENIGMVEQGGECFELKIDRPIIVNGRSKDEDKPKEMIVCEPSDEPGLTISYELNYPEPVGRQYFEFSLNSPEAFRKEIAPARTFGFMKDIERLQKVGLAEGGRLDNFILIGTEGIVNTTLRFDEELARHKILDAVGDLYLLGRPINGRIRAKMTGHTENIKLVGQLREFAMQP